MTRVIEGTYIDGKIVLDEQPTGVSRARVRVEFDEVAPHTTNGIQRSSYGALQNPEVQKMTDADWEAAFNEAEVDDDELLGEWEENN